VAGQTTITQYADTISAIVKAFNWDGVAGHQVLSPPGPNLITVQQGYRRYTDAENFEALVRSLHPVTPSAPPASPIQGYFSFWLKRIKFVEMELSPGKLIGELAVFVPKDTSTDMDAAWDFCITFVQQLGAGANYLASGGFTPPGISLIPPEIECELYKICDETKGGVAIFDFGNYGNGGITIPDP
jgi:hypothetical protein